MTRQMTITCWDWADLSEVWGLPFWSEVKACEEQESVQIRKLLGIISVLCLIGAHAFTQPHRLSSDFSTQLLLLWAQRKGGRWPRPAVGPQKGDFCGKRRRNKVMGDLWCRCTAVPAHHRVRARGSCWRKPDKTMAEKRSSLNGLWNIALLTMSSKDTTVLGTVAIPSSYTLEHSGHPHHVPATSIINNNSKINNNNKK